VRAELAASKSGDRDARNCFLSSSQADAVVDGRKLIGGAQCRFEANGRTSILQHGSILIGLDTRSWARALGEAADEASLSHMEERMLSLRELGIEGRADEVRARVQDAVAQALAESRQAEESSLSAREQELCDELERSKYLQSAWNERGAPAA